MKNKLLIMSLSIILLTGLSTSSFFLNDYLTKVITTNESNSEQLNFAVEQGNLAALYLALNKASLHGVQWLKLAKVLAKTQGDLAYQLAVYYHNEPEKAEFWYKHAIRLNNINASSALAEMYFEKEKLTKAIEILDGLSVVNFEKLNIQSLVLNVNIMIHQGKTTEARKIVNNYTQKFKTSEAGRLLLNEIKKYQIYASDEALYLNDTKVSCDNSIQLFATNLKNLKQLENLIIDFKKQPLSRFVCFSPLRYMAVDSLNCTHEKDQSIQCNEINWQHWADKINTRYVGIMLPEGGANVHYGVLYFDEKDNVDVFSHEVSHLLGFVDEYALVKEHIKCQEVQKTIFSQNISVLNNSYQGSREVVRTQVLKKLAWANYIKSSTPILKAAADFEGKTYWNLGTPKAFEHEVGLFKSKTCDNNSVESHNGFSAFKPLLSRTKLQYFALNFPPFYSALVEENLTQFLMPSFHYNIALAYFQKEPLQTNDIIKVNHWLKQASRWETNQLRRNKVREGRF